jgi:hypothetical protein
MAVVEVPDAQVVVEGAAPTEVVVEVAPTVAVVVEGITTKSGHQPID